MLVSEPLFLWLRAANALSESDGLPAANGAGYYLSAAAVDAALSGKMVARALSSNLSRKDSRKSQDGTAVLSQGEEAALGQVSVMASRQGQAGFGGASERLYIWNLLAPVLSRIGVQLTADDKALIVAGDEDIIATLLVDLQEKMPVTRRTPQKLRTSNSERDGYSSSQVTSRRGDVRSSRDHKRRPAHVADNDVRSSYGSDQDATILPGIPGSTPSYLHNHYTPQPDMFAAHRPSPRHLDGYHLQNPYQPSANGIGLHSHRTPRDPLFRIKDAPAERVQWGALPVDASEPLLMGGDLGGKSVLGTRTCLEFLAALLANHAAGVDVRQASAMLADINHQRKIVAYLCEGGGDAKDGNVNEVGVRWLQDIFSNSQHLAKLLTSIDPGGLVLVMATVQKGLLSPSSDIALWACRILARIGYDLNATNSTTSLQVAYECFVNSHTGDPNQGGLTASIKAAAAHPSVKRALFPVYEQLGKGNLRQLFTQELPLRLRGEGVLSDFLCDLLKQFAENRSGRDAVLANGILTFLTAHCLREALPPHSIQARGAALRLVVECWTSFPQDFQSAVQQAWGALRQAMSPSDVAGAQALQMAAHASVFSLLEHFIENKSQNAAVAYKIIVASLLENYTNSEVRIYIEGKLGRLLHENPRMPLVLLVEPLMRKVRTDGYAEEDFKFYDTLARHPRLEPAQALMILDVMARIAMTDHNSAASATRPLVGLLTRFKSTESVEDFVGRLGKLGMSIVLTGPSADKAEASIVQSAGARKEAVIDVLTDVVRIGHVQYKRQLRPSVEERMVAINTLSSPISDKLQALWDMIEKAELERGDKFKGGKGVDAAVIERPRKKSDDAARKSANNVASKPDSSNRSSHGAVRDNSNNNSSSSTPKEPLSPRNNNNKPKKQPPRYSNVEDQVVLSDESNEDAPVKMSAAERRAQNMQRAKDQLEARKQAIIDARNKKATKPELPHVLTEDEMSKRVSRKELARLPDANEEQPPRPRSVLRAESSSRGSNADSDDERLSLPDKDARARGRDKPVVGVLIRPPSAKTRKREKEIAEIRKKRLQRLQDQQQIQAQQREREKELFEVARKEVERRMAALKAKQKDKAEEDDAKSRRSADHNANEKSFSIISPSKIDVSHSEYESPSKGYKRFDLERHAYLWRAEPRRRENVRIALHMVEDMFNLAVGSGDDRRRSGQSMQASANPLGKRLPSSGERSQSRASNLSKEEIELLNRSVAQDDYLTKMLKRQALLKKKLHMYREERKMADNQRLEEEARLKAAMESEKKREREAEERRRAKIKEKLVKYREKMEQERAAKRAVAEEQEKLTKAERRKKIQDYLKVKEGLKVAESAEQDESASEQDSSAAGKASARSSKSKSDGPKGSAPTRARALPLKSAAPAKGQPHEVAAGGKKMTTPRGKKGNDDSGSKSNTTPREKKGNDNSGSKKATPRGKKGSDDGQKEEKGSSKNVTSDGSSEAVAVAKEADKGQTEDGEGGKEGDGAVHDVAGNEDGDALTAEEASAVDEEQGAVMSGEEGLGSVEAEQRSQSDDLQKDKDSPAGAQQDLVGPDGQKETWVTEENDTAQAP